MLLIPSSTITWPTTERIQNFTTAPPSHNFFYNSGHALFVCVMAPFVLRAVGSQLQQLVHSGFLKYCCSGVDPMKAAFTGTAHGQGVTFSELTNHHHRPPSWEQVRKRSNWGPCTAVSIGVTRLLFWHWLQPLTYWWAFLAYQDEIDRTQWYMGVVVGSREAFYAFIVLVGVVSNPVFLLVDSRAMLMTVDDTARQSGRNLGVLADIRQYLGTACCVDLVELCIYVLLPHSKCLKCFPRSLSPTACLPLCTTELLRVSKSCSSARNYS
jgi:hypothetical protein